MGTVTPLHRGAKVPSPRPEPADLGAWLYRQRNPPSPLRALIDNIRDHSDIFNLGLSMGACLGALGTVGLAWVYAAVAF